MGKQRVFADKVEAHVGDERLNSLRRLLTEEIKNEGYGKPSQRYEFERDRQAYEFAATRQMERLAKRMRYSEDSSLAAKAIDDFKTVNAQAASVRISLPADVSRNAADFISGVLQGYSRSVDPHNIQLDLDFGHLVQLWKHGPGACTWACEDAAVTHPFEKLLSEQPSVTKRCHPFARILRQNTKGLRSFDADKQIPMVEVKGSTLLTVPKNEDTHRTIATEPLGNMMMQLAAGSYIACALKRIGLDIETQQPKNKLLACRASMFNHLATVDLKSASDLITPSLIQELWPREWYSLLMAIRSEHIYIPSEDQWVQVNMLSTMGNGFTFPVMTLTLLALVYATCAFGRRLYIDWSRCAVFGDDIICPTENYAALCEVLNQCGLVVNTTKSYTDGPFRESCGGDYYEGVNVTPFYVKSLRNDPELYVAINQILDWCCRTGIWLPRSIKYLAGSLQRGPFFVPVWDDPYSGIRTESVPRRFNKWQVLPFRRRVDLSSIHPDVAIMAACMGIIESEDVSTIGLTDEERRQVLDKWIARGRATSCVYTPRPKNVKYILVKARLPKGFRDGSAPHLRKTETATFLFCSLA